MSHPEQRGILPHYLSTACFHDLHESCRLECKYCGAPCLCKCHRARPSMHVGGTVHPSAAEE